MALSTFNYFAHYSPNRILSWSLVKHFLLGSLKREEVFPTSFTSWYFGGNFILLRLIYLFAHCSPERIFQSVKFVPNQRIVSLILLPKLQKNEEALIKLLRQHFLRASRILEFDLKVDFRVTEGQVNKLLLQYILLNANNIMSFHKYKYKLVFL